MLWRRDVLEPERVATELREQTITSLLALSGDELAQADVESQLATHGQALELIDARLAASDSAALDAELTQLRASLAGHLDAAEQLLELLSE